MIKIQTLVSGDGVGGRCQAESGEESDEPEEQRDPGAEARGSQKGHRDSVAHGADAGGRGIGAARGRGRGSAAAGEAPGGGRYLTGAA